MNNLHGIIFAHDSDPTLRELTQHRNGSSIPYGGRYRIIDFMLSNMVNAGIIDVGLVVHDSYQSLLDHIGSGKDWDISRKRGGLRILPPFSYADKKGRATYRGRMDALYGVYSYLQNIRQDYVVLAGGNLIVNLPLGDVFDAHLNSGADITAVCTNKPTSDPKDCTYFTIDGKENRITDVAVRPQNAGTCESLDIFILSKSLLLSLVDRCAAHNVSSFGEGVLQPMVDTLKIVPFLFDGYMARVQSVAGYFERSMELLDPAVRADLFRIDRPIRTKDQSNPSTFYGEDASSTNSLISDGCIIEGTVENSILSRGVRVRKGARVVNCILMQSTEVMEDAILQYVITDKNVTIEPGRMLMGHGNYPIAVEKNAVV